MKATLAVIGIIIFVLALGWIGTANNWALTAVFAPRVEQVRYNTFKQSQAYNDGMAQDLNKDEIEWANATPAAKSAMQGAILSQYGSYNSNKLPPEAAAFLDQVRSYHQ